MSYNILFLHKNDLQAIVNINDAIEENLWIKSEIADFLARKENRFGLKLVVENVIASYITCWNFRDTCEIGQIVTGKEFRRRGFASALMNNLTVEFPALKEIFLEVRADNKVAIRFYQSFGYRVTRTRKAYYPDKTDGVEMVLRMERE